FRSRLLLLSVIMGLYLLVLFPLCRSRLLLPFTLFPYTTLFRSNSSRSSTRSSSSSRTERAALPSSSAARSFCSTSIRALATARRSEEHTSELQSRENLVCRLLLEKKKPLCC